MTGARLFRALADGDLAAAMELADCDSSDFIQALSTLTGADVIQCGGCEEPIWADDAQTVKFGDCVCESCRSGNYSYCNECEEYVPDDEVNDIHGRSVCDECQGTYYTYCDGCDDWFRDGEHEHENTCECSAPIHSFNFPADGAGTIANDTRLTVDLPGGIISDVGLAEIRTLVYITLRDTTPDPWGISTIVDSIGPEWQSKRGNLTKRLSRALHLKGLHLPNEVLSEVGNIARAHSTTGTTWAIEFTRDLNQSAGDFYHGDSCWWQSYSSSRCALKNWGGIGLRSFSPYVNGRAWVQPLDSSLQPTHRTADAFAYVVYNGYGDLTGYTPARIIAHLTGMTYTKVKVPMLGCQYVNGNAGYLIADQATCDETESISVSADEHSTFDAHSILTERRVAS